MVENDNDDDKALNKDSLISAWTSPLIINQKDIGCAIIVAASFADNEG